MDRTRNISGGFLARAFAERDKKIERVRVQLNLARCARNKSKVTRLERELRRLGRSMI